MEGDAPPFGVRVKPAGNIRKEGVWMAKKKIFYLIDTENVGDRWLEMADGLKKSEKLIAFYTENHSKLLEKFLVKHVNDPRFVWLESASGNNALDYQLVGVLSYLITKYPAAEYHIFSNDHGYQKSIDFWKNKGIDIRQDVFEIDKPKKKKKKKAKNVKVKAAQEAAFEMPLPAAPVQGGWSREEGMREVARAVAVSDLAGWNSMMAALFGQKEGRECYLKFREDKNLQEILKTYYEGGGRAGGIRLVQILLCHAGLDEGKAEMVYQCLQAHNKDKLQAVKQDLDKRMGTESGVEYYRVVKPVLKLIKKFC